MHSIILYSLNIQWLFKWNIHWIYLYSMNIQFIMFNKYSMNIMWVNILMFNEYSLWKIWWIFIEKSMNIQKDYSLNIKIFNDWIFIGNPSKIFNWLFTEHKMNTKVFSWIFNDCLVNNHWIYSGYSLNIQAEYWVNIIQ